VGKEVEEAGNALEKGEAGGLGLVVRSWRVSDGGGAVT